MSELNLKFLNAKYDNSLPPIPSIPFLPYGVTSIEFAVEGKYREGYIRPENHSMGGAEKMFVGFPNDNKDFLIVWGGGQEKGQTIKEDSDERMFLQVIHLDRNYDETWITFGYNRDIRWKQKLRIFCADNGNVVRMKRMRHPEKGSPHVTITFEGTKVPTYYSRWFPPRPSKGEKIEYHEVEYPKISIEYSEDESGIISPIQVFIEPSIEPAKRICIINGDLGYSFPHAELFSLLPNEGIFVLRLWFYWIHKRVKGGFILGPSNASGEYLGGIRSRSLEVPDIERFDFVIDRKQNRIVLCGTDFHYQELWGKVEEHLVKANIAGGADLIDQTLKRSIYRLYEKGDYENPTKSVGQYILGEMKVTPISVDVVKLKPEEAEHLGAGWRTHVPYVEGAPILKELISSDSRRGAFP